jgi:hypothetical protein
MLNLKAGLNFGALLKLVEDVMRDLPKFEASVSLIRDVIASLEKGQMPALTPQQLLQLGQDISAIQQLIADVKSVMA